MKHRQNIYSEAAVRKPHSQQSPRQKLPASPSGVCKQTGSLSFCKKGGEKVTGTRALLGWGEKENRDIMKKQFPANLETLKCFNLPFLPLFFLVNWKLFSMFQLIIQ